MVVENSNLHGEGRKLTLHEVGEERAEGALDLALCEALEGYLNTFSTLTDIFSPKTVLAIGPVELCPVCPSMAQSSSVGYSHTIRKVR